MRHSVNYLLVLIIAAGCLATTALADPKVAAPASLLPSTKTPSFAQFDADARAGKHLTVAFFGASLTWGANASDQARTSYRARVAQKMEAAYPDAHFTFIDGAIGGTGSNLGVFRLQRDCLSYHPDLVFLDFSANDDIYADGPEKLATYESLVRRIIVDGKANLVPVIFPFKWNSKPGTADAMKGRIAHLKIAKAYNAPVGDAILYIQNLVAKDESLPQKIWNIDGVHPGDYGYQLFADAAWQGYQAGIADQMACEAPDEMLHAPTYMTWSRNRISQLPELPNGWRPDIASRISAWYDALMSRWLDDVVAVRSHQTVKGEDGKKTQLPVAVEPLVIRFNASTVMLFGESTLKSGQLKVFIDGKHVPRVIKNNEIECYDLNSKRFGGTTHFNAVIARDLDTSVAHELKLVPVLAGEEPQEIRLESICLAGGEARILP